MRPLLGPRAPLGPSTKNEWTAEDESGYSAFIQRIGESGCETPDDCINSDVNPYRGTDGRGINFNADCADLVYMLRAYYAWKNGLPFTYVDGVYARGGGDVRFSSKGNRVAGRRNVTGGENGRSVINTIRDAISSATFRIGPDTDESPLTDLYPVKIQRGSIRPGTAIYDVNGHVALVYKVGDDGRIYYMDAHPDFTLTRSVYGAQFGRDFPAMGAGFKNFRPIRLERGRIQIAKNNQIADYSTEQYFGNVDPNPQGDWRKAKFAYDGIEAGFYEYVRIAMAERQAELQSGRRAQGDDEDAVQRPLRPPALRRHGDRSGRRPQTPSRTLAGQHLRHRQYGMGNLFHAFARRAPEDRVPRAARRHGTLDLHVDRTRRPHFL